MWDVKYHSNLFVYSYLPVIQVAYKLQLLESSPFISHLHQLSED
jgi:hypothetical protein